MIFRWKMRSIASVLSLFSPYFLSCTPFDPAFSLGRNVLHILYSVSCKVYQRHFRDLECPDNETSAWWYLPLPCEFWLAVHAHLSSQSSYLHLHERKKNIYIYSWAFRVQRQHECVGGDTHGLFRTRTTGGQDRPLSIAPHKVKGQSRNEPHPHAEFLNSCAS